MSHWAELDSNNKVIRVTVGNNNEDDEGYQWLIDNLGGNWVKTSYNGNIRKRFAGIGYTYDSGNDVFVAPKPTCHPEVITFDEANYCWTCEDSSHEAKTE